MANIDIVRKVDANGIESVQFDPPRLQVGVGESIFFRNRDNKAQHWITRKGKSQDFWFRSALAPYTGEPPDVSSEIVFQSDPGEDITYACSLHPGEEGVIAVG